MERQFKVIPIRLSLKGNKFANSRDIVAESQLTSPANELIEAGAVVEVVSEATPAVDQDADQADTGSADVVDTIEVVSEVLEIPKRRLKK